MLFGLLLAAAEESRHLEIPPAERAIGRSLLERRVEPQHRQQLVPDVAAILEALAQAERFGERAHVGGDPEVSFGPVRLERRPPCVPRRCLARAAPCARLPARARRASTRARELPRGLEVLRVLLEAAPPRWPPPAARSRGRRAWRTARRDRRAGWPAAPATAGLSPASASRSGTTPVPDGSGAADDR